MLLKLTTVIRQINRCEIIELMNIRLCIRLLGYVSLIEDERYWASHLSLIINAQFSLITTDE